MASARPGRTPVRPRSEGELIHQRPASHRHGAFPRRLLLPGERVLLEGRPDLWAARGGRLVVFGVLLATTLFGGAVGLSATGPGSDHPSDGLAVLTATLLFGLLWGTWIAAVLLSWHRTAFALTHTRVLLVRGFWGSEFRSARLGEVQSLYASRESVGSVIFEIRTGPPLPGAPSSIVWEAVRGAPQTYAFVHELFALRHAEVIARARDQLRRDAVLRGRVVCAYCGNPVDLRSADPSDPRCPRCSAPLPPSSPVAVVAPVPAPAADHGSFLRPVVYLGGGAVGWYRATMFIVTLVALTIPFLVAPSAGASAGVVSGPLYVGVVLAFLILVPLAFVLGGQVLRKWRTTVRTLLAGLPPGPAGRPTVANSLRRKLDLAVGTFGLAIGLLVATIATLPVSIALIGSGSAPASWSAIIGAELGGFALAIVASQLLLVTSFPVIAAGSGDRRIQLDLARGRAISVASLLAGLVPVAGLLYLLVATPTSFPSGSWVWWADLLSPIGNFLGLSLTAQAFDRWVALADQRWSEASSRRAPTPGFLPSGETMETVSWLDAPSTPGTFPAVARGWGVPPMRTFAVFALVAVLLLVAGGLSAGWVAHELTALSQSSRPTYHEPPIVVAKSGAVWPIKGGYFAYEFFRVNRSATLSGTFASTGPVSVYVMDSNSFALFQIQGRAVYDLFGARNVSSDALHVNITSYDRWYIVLDNTFGPAAIDVTWSSECAVDFVA
jgi:hypothetical protein